MCHQTVVQWICTYCGEKADQKFVSSKKRCHEARKYGCCQKGVTETIQKQKLDWIVCGPCQLKNRKPKRGLYD